MTHDDVRRKRGAAPGERERNICASATRYDGILTVQLGRFMNHAP